MSRVVRFHRLGGPEVLQIEEIPDRALKEGEMRPFDSIVEAHRYLESNVQVGKIVVTVG